MLIDHTIIARQSPYDVLGQTHEVMFRDGSAVKLHPVSTPADKLPAYAGPYHPFLRALQVGRDWVLFDLRHVVRGIADDLPPAHWHDRPGIVFYSLRGTFASARAFQLVVAAQLLTAWRPADEREAVAA